MSYDTGLQPLDLDLDLEALERAVRPTARERVDAKVQAIGTLLRSHAVDVAVVAVLSVIAYVVHVRGMYTSPARFDDEGTYTAYAWALQTKHELGHYTYWYAHPPLGTVQIALWTWLTDAFNSAPYAVAAVRELMVLAKVVSVVLLYALALRLRMTRAMAALTVLMFALSPLSVYFTRTALLDNLVTPWLLAAFLLAAAPRRSLLSAAGSAVCFAIAVLTKETALLFLPAVVVLLFQCSDRRNRRFVATVFGTTLVAIGAAYPLYALIKNELLDGPGHVSLEWAIRWQLFERQGSGSIFDPHTAAHAVTSSWVALDPVLPTVALLALIPGLLLRRTRAVALAFGIQAAELLRSGYLPYPFVVAMIPFAALTIAGVLDVAWQAAWPQLPPQLLTLGWVRTLVEDRPGRRSVLQPGRLLRRPVPRWTNLAGTTVVRGAVVVVVLLGMSAVDAPWRSRLHDLWHNDRDASAASALAWVRQNVDPSHLVVVDDAFWVDLVRSGYDQKRVVWFTKLDVDPGVKLPADPQWKAIDYIVLTRQDEMSLHMTLDGKPSQETKAQYPTLGAALTHARPVMAFGTGLDSATIWRVIHPTEQHRS